MEFFRIQQNESCVPIPLIQESGKALPPRLVHKKNFWDFPQNNGVFVASNYNNVYSDIIDKQIYLISEKTKHVFDLYTRDILYQQFCLLDNPNNLYKIYYHPFFEEVKCLHPASKHNINKTVFQEIVLNEEAIQGRHIFRVKDVNTLMVVISLQAVESLLRRNAEGIKLTSIMCRREK